MSKIILLDDLLSKKEQDEIENYVSSTCFPWFYYKKSTDGINYNNLFFKETEFFCHLSYLNNEPNSIEHSRFIQPYFEKIWHQIPELFDAKFYSLIRSKVNLFKKTNNFFDPRVLPWHTDFDYPHIVCLYYVNDCDGKTIFKNGKSFKPKKGNFLIFDGTLEHTHALPIHNDRFVVNSNLFVY
jgi:hypothetical protein